MAKEEFLISMNQKAGEDPAAWAVVNELRRSSPAVTLLGKDPAEIAPGLAASARAWVVMGGDGSLHHAVNALMALPKADRCPLWYIPHGTGNDFARTVGLGETPPPEFIRQALAEEGVCRPLAVGRCNDRYFLNMASGGLFATVTTEANPQLKSLAGRFSYFLSGIGKLLERKTIPTRIDGGAAEPLLGFFVGNAKFAGGGIQIAADADPFQAELEFLTVPELPTPQLVSLGLELQKESPDLSAFPVTKKSVSKLVLEFAHETPINLDGEQVSSRRAAFSVEDGAVKIFVPKLI
jgi:YegS/Rv2252/BmrU family lipid kinase